MLLRFIDGIDLIGGISREHRDLTNKIYVKAGANGTAGKLNIKVSITNNTCAVMVING